MKSPNAKASVPDDPAFEAGERALRALLTVDLDDEDAPPSRPLDASSERCMLPLPRPPRFDG